MPSEHESAPPHDSALAGLRALVNKSLVQPTSEPSAAGRFRMLGTIREYALEQLAAHGEEEAVRAANATVVGAAAERGEGAAHLPTKGTAHSLSKQERANLRPTPGRIDETGDLAATSAPATTAPAVPRCAVASGLTAREAQVLALLTRRLSDREIAGELGISARTAQRHVARILDKLRVKTRRQAAALAASDDGWATTRRSGSPPG